jgi:hypothetical protein
MKNSALWSVNPLRTTFQKIVNETHDKHTNARWRKTLLKSAKEHVLHNQESAEQWDNRWRAPLCTRDRHTGIPPPQHSARQSGDIFSYSVGGKLRDQIAVSTRQPDRRNFSKDTHIRGILTVTLAWAGKVPQASQTRHQRRISDYSIHILLHTIDGKINHLNEIALDCFWWQQLPYRSEFRI